MTLPEPALSALAEYFRDRLSTAAAVREAHGRDESHHAPMPPDAVVFARSTEDVAAAVRICAAHRIPVIAFGAGTGLEGQVTAPRGGVCVDMTCMNRVLSVRSQDLDATVQPGVTHRQLNREIRDTGLFFPVDPGADATLGGMAATRASGTNAVRYGTMKDNVVALEVVLPDGSVVRTGRRARKSSAGYDLTRLFIGSEGTLGIITELTIRLHGIPEAVSAAVCPFPSTAEAVNCVILAIQSGIPLARVEFMDAFMVDAVNRYSGTSHEVAPTLFFEFHGTADGVAEQVRQVKTIAEDLGGIDFRWACNSEERSRLWSARHTAYWAGLALAPGRKAWTSDICVPISRLAECLVAAANDLDASFLIGGIVGHVGDGNFHVMELVDPTNPDEVAEAERLNTGMVARALAMDGTCSGEHGVGVGKMNFMAEEFGNGLDLMRRIKLAVDPDQIMNPGKMLPPPFH